MTRHALGLDNATLNVARWATLSDDEVYRYALGRRWAAGPLLGWVMLNPSTADAEVDDPTIRRCMAFSRDLGYSGLMVGNLYALRATDPRELDRHAAPIGPDNDDYLAHLASLGTLICAWGARAPDWIAERALDILAAGRADRRCLGRTAGGAPRHPLYVRGDTIPGAYP